MKTFVALAALAIAHATGATAANTDVKSEFLRWKASAAGQVAYQNGFVPASSSRPPSKPTGMSTMSVTTDTEPTNDELTRFEDALNEITRVQALQPHATFSINTPFALMTKAEFEEHVGKSDAETHLKELQKKIAAQPLVVDDVTTFPTLAVNSSTTTTTTKFTTMNNATRRLDTWSVNVDWQTNGCVARVKDQGRCSVCWAFSAIGALESANCVRGGGLVELSEQAIVSCARDKPMCVRANSADSFDWITRLNGGSVCTAASYPYASGDGSEPTCKLYVTPSAAQPFQCNKPNLGAYFYTGGNFDDHTQLEAAVLRQPVAASIHNSWDGFRFYTGGMFMGNEQYCPGDQPDHEVLIVGFGTLNGVPYWKIKNQWSEYWGDHGYMYIERGYQGHRFGACAIENFGYYPVFTSASDARLNKRATTPRWGFGNVGPVFKVVTGTWSGDECASRCMQETACVAFNFIDSTYHCELLSSTTGIIGRLVYYGTIITKAESIARCAPIANNVDHQGNDLRTTVAATAEECCDHCGMVEKCNAFTWSKYNNGMCYLKTQAAAWPVTTAPDSDGTPFLKAGSIYRCQPLRVDMDRPGFDLGSAPASTAATCCGICRSTTDCSGFSWTNYNGGTCWLKKYGGSYVAGQGVISGTIY